MKKAQIKKVEDILIPGNLILNVFSDKELIQSIIVHQQHCVDRLKKEIAEELDYAKNETNSYRLQKIAAKKAAEVMKKELKVRTKILLSLSILLNQFDLLDK